MSCDFSLFATPGVQGLSPYQPGKPIAELKRELGIENIIKLASNENPLGVSPRVLEAIQRELPELARYPDGNGFVLKEALASHYGLGMEQFTLGNGSNDVLEVIARVFLRPEDEAIYAQHAFAVYPLVVQAIGAQGIEVPAKAYGHDLDAMADAVTERTKLIFLANPNNPTGTAFTHTAFVQFMQKVPRHIVVVLDEAYIEYVQNPALPDGVDYLADYPNLIVTRTFSKAYGLASLRVGYAMASAQITGLLNRVRQPFNVNSLALVAGAAALSDQAFVTHSRELNAKGMTQLEEGARQLGLEWIPSAGNFLCLNVRQPGQTLFAALLKEGVIVRPVANYGLVEFIRVSIGLPEENQRFLRALSKVLA